MNDDIARAQAAADAIRDIWPEKAAEIENAIAAARDGRRDGVAVSIGISFKLEKFAGGANGAPVEVIERHHTL